MKRNLLGLQMIEVSAPGSGLAGVYFAAIGRRRRRNEAGPLCQADGVTASRYHLDGFQRLWRPRCHGLLIALRSLRAKPGHRRTAQVWHSDQAAAPALQGSGL